MWYNYKKHVCEKCGEEFKYSADTLTFARGTKCPHCGIEYGFNVTEIVLQEELDKQNENQNT
jgi:DNA-directed RNA polymerase subunit RPC12/RpoP